MAGSNQMKKYCQQEMNMISKLSHNINQKPEHKEQQIQNR